MWLTSHVPSYLAQFDTSADGPDSWYDDDGPEATFMGTRSSFTGTCGCAYYRVGGLSS